MAATGVNVADSVISQFNDMKLGRIKAKYIIYEIQKSSIETKKVGDDGADFNTFLADLPENEGRYAVYDMAFTTNDGRNSNKLVFIAWAPDTAPVKTKMIYAGSKDALTRALVGISVKINATDMSELTEDIVKDACKKFA